MGELDGDVAMDEGHGDTVTEGTATSMQNGSAGQEMQQQHQEAMDKRASDGVEEGEENGQEGSGGEEEEEEEEEGEEEEEEEEEREQAQEGEREEAVEYPHKKRQKTKKEREEERREKGLGEVLLMMDDYCPIIPDAVTDYYLARSGFECDDIRVKRLLALAAQKFIADIASDAYQHCKIRQQATQGKEKKGSAKKTVLTVDDLSGALAEHGINVKKPEYFS
ncbi:Transcription initiation factor TFIID subunit 10 [Dinochytrium kinnereticum]|nr:Transcription initiation factor TFIID subunit 10 [Dinochytrium kinnereticum]